MYCFPVHASVVRFGFSGEEPVEQRVGLSIAALMCSRGRVRRLRLVSELILDALRTLVVEALAAGDGGTFDG